MVRPQPNGFDEEGRKPGTVAPPSQSGICVKGNLSWRVSKTTEGHEHLKTQRQVGDSSLVPVPCLFRTRAHPPVAVVARGVGNSKEQSSMSGQGTES